MSENAKEVRAALETIRGGVADLETEIEMHRNSARLRDAETEKFRASLIDSGTELGTAKFKEREQYDRAERAEKSRDLAAAQTRADAITIRDLRHELGEEKARHEVTTNRLHAVNPRTIDNTYGGKETARLRDELRNAQNDLAFAQSETARQGNVIAEQIEIEKRLREQLAEFACTPKPRRRTIGYRLREREPDSGRPFYAATTNRYVSCAEDAKLFPTFEAAESFRLLPDHAWRRSAKIVRVTVKA
jgi:hypothetical protein